MKKFNTAVFGGTFDHFHRGHRKLLEFGLSVSERLIIGVTSDEFVSKFKISNLKFKIKAQKFENFETRKKNLEGFLNKLAKGRFKIIKIEDLFGPTLDKDFLGDVILVSSNTIAGAEKINKERAGRGLSEFKIIVVPQVLAEDGRPISSFRIRSGEIDREGKLYLKPFWFKKTLVLPQKLREEFRKPLGKIVADINDISDKRLESLCLITVGDETTRIFNQLSMRLNIAVVDFKIARKRKFSNIEQLGFSAKEKTIRVKNPAGTITPELFKTVHSIFEKTDTKNPIIILIDGEDDFSVLPLILTSPLGCYVYYGQPGKGIVEILVDENVKAKIRRILARFKTLGY